MTTLIVGGIVSFLLIAIFGVILAGFVNRRAESTGIEGLPEPKPNPSPERAQEEYAYARSVSQYHGTTVQPWETQNALAQGSGSYNPQLAMQGSGRGAVALCILCGQYLSSELEQCACGRGVQ